MRLSSKFFSLLIVTLALVYVGSASGQVSAQSQSATLSFEKASATSESISANVVVDTGDNTIKAVTADFSYSPDILQIQEIVINQKVCKEIVKQDVSSSGFVYISCYSKDGYMGKGTIATVSFKILQYEDTKLIFSNKAIVMDQLTHSDILTKADSADITIPSSLSGLPQTGVEETDIFQGIIVLIVILFILLFAIAGFSTWGGIYFSLGKWEVKGSVKIKTGKSHKHEKTKKKKTVKKK